MCTDMCIKKKLPIFQALTAVSTGVGVPQTEAYALPSVKLTKMARAVQQNAANQETGYTSKHFFKRYTQLLMEDRKKNCRTNWRSYVKTPYFFRYTIPYGCHPPPPATAQPFRQPPPPIPAAPLPPTPSAHPLRPIPSAPLPPTPSAALAKT